MSAALVVQWQSEERAPTPPCRRRSLLQAHVVSSVDYASRSSRASSPSERGVALIPRLLSLRSTLRAAIRQAAFASLRLPPHYKVALLVVRWQSEERARHRLVSAPPCYMRMWFSSVDNVSRSPRTSLPSEGGGKRQRHAAFGWDCGRENRDHAEAAFSSRKAAVRAASGHSTFVTSHALQGGEKRPPN